jgi:hypothetical protein
VKGCVPTLVLSSVKQDNRIQVSQIIQLTQHGDLQSKELLLTLFFKEDSLRAA